MFAEVPVNLQKLSKESRDKEIIRTAIQAELDAINLYEQMAHIADDALLREVLLDVAREEKTHVGEFHTLLLRLDQEQEAELEDGKNEVEEMSEE